MEPTYDLNYRALVEARGTLNAMASALYGANIPDARHSLYAGVAHEACTTAEEAIFRALNVIACYLGDQEASRVVHMREWKSAADEADEADA